MEKQGGGYQIHSVPLGFDNVVLLVKKEKSNKKNVITVLGYFVFFKTVYKVAKDMGNLVNPNIS